jgi:hypothetical protein
MMRFWEYVYAACSGAFIVLASLFIERDDPVWVVVSVIGFIACMAMIKIQPTNVNDGLIVRRSALTVFSYVHDRPVVWCGTRHLHDMHVHSQREPVNDTTMFVREREVVCLGHECHCPEVHMQKIGQE